MVSCGVRSFALAASQIFGGGAHALRRGALPLLRDGVEARDPGDAGTCDGDDPGWGAFQRGDWCTGVPAR